MRWCVVGAGGQVGSAASNYLKAGVTPLDHEVFSLSRSELDLTDMAAVSATLKALQPDVVLNAAAYTQVDQAEIDRPAAILINETCVANLATCSAEVGAAFIHLSTDYVFDGMKGEPYVESDEPNPVSFYGKTKYAGELLAVQSNPRTWIIRTSWVYHPGFSNFPASILRRLSTGETVKVVDDQLGSPTAATDLVAGLCAIVELGADFGIYHLASQGEVTWFGFAREIAHSCGFDVGQVEAIKTDQLHSLARRPTYSVLSTQKWQSLGAADLPNWQVAWQREAPEFMRVLAA